MTTPTAEDRLYLLFEPMVWSLHYRRIFILCAPLTLPLWLLAVVGMATLVFLQLSAGPLLRGWNGRQYHSETLSMVRVWPNVPPKPQADPPPKRRAKRKRAPFPAVGMR